jgi:putative ABC transport system permease protein
MKTLFGAPMDSVMTVLLGAFLLVTAVLAGFALRNRLLFKLGLRNIPRRRAQTILIIVGLMLSTTIITSAFGTGDTVSYSVRSTTVSSLGAIDETVSSAAANTVTGGAQSAFSGASSSNRFLPVAAVRTTSTAMASNPDVDGVLPVVSQHAPLQDPSSGQTKAGGDLLGVPTTIPATFGPLNTISGATVTPAQLERNEVYLNEKAATALNARPSDTLRVFVGGRVAIMQVRAVLRNENLAGGGLLSAGSVVDPVVLLPLANVQQLLAHPGAVTTLLISNRGDAETGATYSDSVTTELRTLLANGTQVATAHSLLRSHAGQADLTALTGIQTDNGVKTKLEQLQTQAAVPAPSRSLTTLLSDPDVIAQLQTIKDPQVARPLNDALAAISDYSVQPIKQQALASADLFGNLFTSVFMVFGLFSIATGIMLIFLIFVMLAAERRAEMGMARAIGTKRRHLIQQFLFEGYVYNLAAALVGIVLGIGVGLLMVKVMASVFGTAGISLQSHVEPRSVVVAFSLGALVTFITVAVSSWRISRLTIVAAIRDLPDPSGSKGTVGAAFKRPLTDLANVGRRLRRGRVPGALAALIAAPWHFLTAWLVFIGRGPLLLLLGYLLARQGAQEQSQFSYGVGVSLLIVGAANLVRWILAVRHVSEARRNRIGFSLAGIGLVTYWLLPYGTLKVLGQPDQPGSIGMFFVTGIMLVMGGVWTVIYNADVLLAGLLRLAGSLGRLGPAIKMAVTYPLQHKFRTGMTLAMFSLVIFTQMVMSILVGSFNTGLNLDRDAGGYQIYGAANPNSPIAHLNQTIAANPALRTGITATGALTKVAVGLRQPGQADQSWQAYGANIMDDAYLATTRFTLHSRANGFGSDRQVWQTLQNRPGFAVVDSSLVPSKNGGIGGGAGFMLSGFYYEDRSFAPTLVEMRDNQSGAVLRLRRVVHITG